MRIILRPLARFNNWIDHLPPIKHLLFGLLGVMAPWLIFCQLAEVRHEPILSYIGWGWAILFLALRVWNRHGNIDKYLKR